MIKEVRGEGRERKHKILKKERWRKGEWEGVERRRKMQRKKWGMGRLREKERSEEEGREKEYERREKREH